MSYPKEQMSTVEVPVPPTPPPPPPPTQGFYGYPSTSNFGNITTSSTFSPIGGGGFGGGGFGGGGFGGGGFANNQRFANNQGFAKQEMARTFKGQERPKWIIPAIVIGVILCIALLIAAIVLPILLYRPEEPTYTSTRTRSRTYQN